MTDRTKKIIHKLYLSALALVAVCSLGSTAVIINDGYRLHVAGECFTERFNPQPGDIVKDPPAQIKRAAESCHLDIAENPESRDWPLVSAPGVWMLDPHHIYKDLRYSAGWLALCWTPLGLAIGIKRWFAWLLS